MQVWAWVLLACALICDASYVAILQIVGEVVRHCSQTRRWGQLKQVQQTAFRRLQHGGAGAGCGMQREMRSRLLGSSNDVPGDAVTSGPVHVKRSAAAAAHGSQCDDGKYADSKSGQPRRPISHCYGGESNDSCGYHSRALRRSQ